MQYEVLRFSANEAKHMIGRQIRTRVEFAGVPMGTTGSVVDIYEFADNAFDVVIQWNIANDSNKPRNRFAKSGYLKNLSEQSETAAPAR